MGSPSSTSSSSRRASLPTAGLLAAALVLLLDRAVFAWLVPWEALEARIPVQYLAERGVVRDRIEIARACPAEPDAPPLLAVLGSSRAGAGFRPDLLPAAEREAFAYAALAHPGMMPFEMRSWAAALADCAPAVVALAVSEIETHHPLRITPWLSSGSPDAIVDLVRAAGARWALRERRTLYRLSLVGALETYRYRTVLRRAGLDALRLFPAGPRLAGRAPPPPPYRPREGAEAEALRARLEQRARGRVRTLVPFRLEMAQLETLVGGDDARIQQQLLRGLVRAVRRQGSRIVLVEPPVFPGANALYPARFRAEFREFAAALARESDGLFVPLEDQPAYRPEDFLDLTHLDARGAARLTGAIVAAARRVIGPKSGRARAAGAS